MIDPRCLCFGHNPEIRFIRKSGGVTIEVHTSASDTISVLEAQMMDIIRNRKSDVVSARKTCARCRSLLEDYLA